MAKDRRCYADRRQYLIAAVRKRRKKIREMAVKYKGGKCEICGYSRCTEALEFHHVDTTGKDFSISDKGYTRSWRRVREELDKCILVCANCHREIHARPIKSAAFDGNIGVKNRVNSGKPALRKTRRMVILSQALNSVEFKEGAETIPRGSTLQYEVGGEAPDTLPPDTRGG